MEEKTIWLFCPFISNPTTQQPCLKELCQLWNEEISNCELVALSKGISRIEELLYKEIQSQLSHIYSYLTSRK